jgi:hypothetical protein
LEDAQQLRLQGERHLADLVEEEVPPFACATRPVGAAGVGEGAAGMAEELAFEQGLRDGGAIDRDEGAVLPPAALVEGARDELLPGAGLAQTSTDESVSATRSISVDLLHGGARPIRSPCDARRARPPQALHLGLQAAVLDGALERERQHLMSNGLVRKS